MAAAKRSSDGDRAIADDSASYEAMFEGEALGPLTESVWSYQLDGSVFGPVSVRELLELLYEGKVDAETLVSSEDDDDFIALRRYGAFRHHLQRSQVKLAARAQREAEASAVRAALRKRQFRWLGVGTAMALLMSVGVYWWVYVDRNARLEQAEAARLENEIAKLLAGISIEPPLLPLVENPSKPRSSSARKGGVRSKKGRSPSSGPLSQREVFLGLNRNFRGIVSCIKKQLAREPQSVPESVVLEFVIDNGGRAQSLRMQDRFLRRSPLQTCLSKRIGRIRWRAFKGEVRNVVYPISVRRPD